MGIPFGGESHMGPCAHSLSIRTVIISFHVFSQVFMIRDIATHLLLRLAFR